VQKPPRIKKSNLRAFKQILKKQRDLYQLSRIGINESNFHLLKNLRMKQVLQFTTRRKRR
jgi:hypothetical protein